MEETNFHFGLDVDIDLFFSSLSNNDPAIFNFDAIDTETWSQTSEFIDGMFSAPIAPSHFDTTVPRFSELTSPEQLETLNVNSNDLAIDAMPVVVAPVANNVKRTRTRRKTAAVIKGCNMYGRAGKKRCFQCRKWKQKCVYETLDDPCKLCQEHGLECGRKEKVFGPKTQQLQRSGREMERASGQLVFAIPRVSPRILNDELNSFEIHLYSMLGIWKFSDTPDSRSPGQIIRIPRRGTYERYYHGCHYSVVWLDFHLSSKVFRYAALALASTMQSSKTYDSNGAGSDYLAKFYEYMREAIESTSISEIFIASYIMVIDSWFQGTDLQTIFTHSKGMYIAYSLLTDGVSATATYPVSYVRLLMLSMNYMIFETYFLRPPSETTELRLCQELDALVRALETSLATGSDVDDLLILNKYLRLYLDCYLLERRTRFQPIETSSLLPRIRATLSEIFRLFRSVPGGSKVISATLDSSLPWPWRNNASKMDQRLDLDEFLEHESNQRALYQALLYGYALVIAEATGGALFPASCVPASPGLILCRLCALMSAQPGRIFPRFHLLPYFLWAGLGLVDGVEPAASAWICFMLDNHTFWTRNQMILPEHQWRLNSLSQNLYRANMEGRQAGDSLFELKGIDILECNRIAERVVVTLKYFGRWMSSEATDRNICSAVG